MSDSTWTTRLLVGLLLAAALITPITIVRANAEGSGAGVTDATPVPSGLSSEERSAPTETAVPTPPPTPGPEGVTPTEMSESSGSFAAALVVAGPNLIVDKHAIIGEATGDPLTVTVGDQANFRILVINAGDATATGITVIDNLPDGIDWQTSRPGCSIVPDVGEVGQVLTCPEVELGPGGAFEVVVSGPTDAGDCGTLTNTVTASGANEPTENTGDNGDAGAIIVAGDCPEPTATPTPEPTATATPEPAATATPEPTVTPTPEPTNTPTPDPTASATPDPTSTPTPEPTATATPEPTATVPPDPCVCPESTATPTPEPTTTTTPEPTATATPEPTSTPPPDPCVCPGPTSTPTPESTSTPTTNPCGCQHPSPTASPTPTPGPSPTASPPAEPSPSPSPTTTPAASPSPTSVETPATPPSQLPNTGIGSGIATEGSSGWWMVMALVALAFGATVYRQRGGST